MVEYQEAGVHREAHTLQLDIDGMGVAANVVAGLEQGYLMALREQLKDKPQEMQQAMMRIYREEKVNPLGGCLPILVQMPIFIALYWVLLSTVEMRNAAWIGWITDLSSKDPFYILPLLMTASTLFQTWLNPTPPDPVQSKMMWIMPLVFSVMFFVFPAGLVLYWFTNNLLGIAQQWLINRQLGVSK
jgi:YidC/Oxa1 family membrane protein insertase